jgi:RNA polymerase sigma-70 factor (ECF subfamily)
MDANNAQKSFLKGYDDFSADLLRHAIIKTSDEDLAKDLVSETFLKTWEFAKKEKVKNMRALLYKILNNLIIDHYRSRKQFVPLEEMPESEEPADKTDLQAGLEIKLATEKAREYLSLLPADYREIFNYKFIDGLSTSEIKELTGKTLTNIYVSIHRGTKLLREKLKHHEI